MNSLWHNGELEMQRRAGVIGAIDAMAGRVIKDRMTDAQRRFLEGLPFVLAATIDPEGEVWATLLGGAPGFMDASDPQSLRITLTLDPHDPASSGLAKGEAVALLGIDFPTRRRARLNGRVSRFGETSFDVQVLQSYGNCSQYIHERELTVQSNEDVLEPQWGDSLLTMAPRARALVRSAKTFFVGSYAKTEGAEPMVDVSHKGGPPGFVHLGGNGELTIPDFSGNHFFNTLGNLLLNPRCGLVFADFETGDVLQLVGDAVVLKRSPVLDDCPGAERLWRFIPRKVVLRGRALKPARHFQGSV